MGKRHGFTLIEMLLSMFISLFIVHGIVLLLVNFNRVNISYFNDLSYCLYSLSEELSMANNVEVYEDKLILYHGDDISTIQLNKNRIVRSPGFNIYLHHVDYISFSNDSTYIYMHLQRGKQYGTFKIGVYYRPTFRICESDCNDSITNDSFDDHVDGNISESIP